MGVGVLVWVGAGLVGLCGTKLDVAVNGKVGVWLGLKAGVSVSTFPGVWTSGSDRQPASSMAIREIVMLPVNIMRQIAPIEVKFLDRWPIKPGTGLEDPNARLTPDKAALSCFAQPLPFVNDQPSA